MPFLVDSVSIVFKRAEIAVHLIVHPVLDVHRDGRGRIVEAGANGNGNGNGTTPPRRVLAALRDRPPERSGADSRRLQRDIEATLADVHVAVADWAAMRDKATSIVSLLETNPPPLPADEISEARRLLEWMEARHFVFLGYRHYTLERGSSEDQLVPDTRSGLGILRNGDRETSTLRHDGTARRHPRAALASTSCLILTKANSTATVHRGEYLDYIGVKTFDERGKVNGEHRFLGLWTSTAYHRQPARHPRSAPESRASRRVLRPRPCEPRRQGRVERPRDLSARRAFPGERR